MFFVSHHWRYSGNKICRQPSRRTLSFILSRTHSVKVAGIKLNDRALSTVDTAGKTTLQRWHRSKRKHK